MVKVEHWVVRSPLGSRVAIRRSGTSRAVAGHIASHDKMGTAVCTLHCQSGCRKKMRGNDQMITYPWTFEVGVETSKVAAEPIHQEVVVGSSKTSVDKNRWVDRRSQRIVRERVGYTSQGLGSETPSDAVRTRVHPDGVLEASRRDLNIVVGISPATQPTHSVVVEHCRVLSVGGIWYAMFENTKGPRKVGEDIPRVQSQYGVAPV